MRVLNTNLDPSKKFKRFNLPGFRSGSLIKKIIAVFYYFFVLVFMCSLTSTFATGDFSGPKDIILLIAVELCILAVFLSPVVAIGFSNHFDWHGIKLFLIIMIPICIFMTLGQWFSALFSIEYIESVNPSQKQIEKITDTATDSDGSISDAISDSSASPTGA